MKTEEKIRNQLNDNAIILYMKGVPEQPECGFSAKAVAALKSVGSDFAFVNILQAPFIREKLPEVSNWPTFPQLFIKGELVGGSDIIEAMHEDGSLLSAIQAIEAEPVESKQTDGMSHAEVSDLIKRNFPDAVVYIEGEGCDLLVTVVSEKFNNMSLVKQQQGVMLSLKEPLESGRLHAVSIKSYTPSVWSGLQASKMGDGLLQIKL